MTAPATPRPAPAAPAWRDPTTVALPVIGQRPAGRNRAGRAAVPVGVPAVLLAAALWATVGPAAALLPDGTDPLAVGAARMLGGGVLFALLGCRPAALRRLRAIPDALPVVLVAAGGMAIYQGCYFSAMHLTGVAVGSVVTATSTPIFTGLAAVLLRRGRPGRRWYLGTALAVAANACLVLGPGGGTVSAAGVLCGLAGGAAYAGFATACGVAVGKGAASPTVMAVSLLGAGLAMTPLVALTGVGWLAAPGALIVVGYLAAAGTVGAYLLFGRGLERTAPATATSLALIEPALAALLGLLLLRETPGASTAAGLLVMAAALAAFTLHRGAGAATPWGLTWTILPARPGGAHRRAFGGGRRGEGDPST
ncbi:hypothetical protein GCM10010123_29100 [Pilimelia anulata]|uniref:EamA domain-containing protein n=1 Tax=Pilimelia anulata TaxID=53371 RepID=A0A8J3FDR9_9ACTN|nr:EamA family transporter [Pilimelia anulata]GGJ97274.1 hypothetical protein GCM10010123_29100 [Pilimelia anulata]